MKTNHNLMCFLSNIVIELFGGSPFCDLAAINHRSMSSPIPPIIRRLPSVWNTMYCAGPRDRCRLPRGRDGTQLFESPKRTASLVHVGRDGYPASQSTNRGSGEESRRCFLSRATVRLHLLGFAPRRCGIFRGNETQPCRSLSYVCYDQVACMARDHELVRRSQASASLCADW